MSPVERAPSNDGRRALSATSYLWFTLLAQVLLQDRRIRSRVLFGSDFYVVQNARLEERSRSVRIRAILGEELYRELAEENPRSFLNLNRSKLQSDLQSGRLVV